MHTSVADPNALDPARMSSAERVTEIGRTLALGLLRLLRGSQRLYSSPAETVVSTSRPTHAVIPERLGSKRRDNGAGFACKTDDN